MMRHTVVHAGGVRIVTTRTVCSQLAGNVWVCFFRLVLTG